MNMTLRVSNPDAQKKRTDLSLASDKGNSLNQLDYNESLESAKSLIISQSSIGGWDDRNFNHEENQDHPNLDYGNPLSFSESVNQSSLRGAVHRVGGYENFVKPDAGATYESFVGEEPTDTKSAGHRVSGNMPVYRQCARYWMAALISNPIQYGDEARTTSSVTPIASLYFISHDLIVTQPFGSIPRFLSSLRANSLNQLLKVILSSLAASFSCCLSSGWIRIWNAGDWPPDFGVRSFTLDIVHTFSLNEFHKVCTLYHSRTLIQAPPKGAENTNRGLTSNVKRSNAMAKPQCNQTHLFYSNKFSFRQFTWRFLALSVSDCRVIHITATTEREAREQSPAGCVMVFAGRLPAEVRHV